MTGVSSTPGLDEAEIDRLFQAPTLREFRERGNAAFLASSATGEVIWANESARRLLGRSLSTIPARLAGGPTGPSLRLRRLLIDLGGGARPLTLLTRGAALAAFPEAVLAIVLGAPEHTADESAWREPLAPEPVADAPAQQKSEPVGAPALASAHEIRTRLLKTHRNPAIRFLWQTGAAGRVTSVTPPLAEIVGAENADIVGRSLAEIAETLQLDPSGRLAAAIGVPQTWSGIEAAWPIAGAAAAVSVDLGGVPIFDAARTFQGFRGFGVLHLDRIREAEPLPDGSDGDGAAGPGPAAPPAGEEAALQAEPARSPEPSPEPSDVRTNSTVTALNVVPLRPHAPGSAPFAPWLPPSDAPGQKLSEREHEAFDEIARTLNDAPAGAADPAAPADAESPAHSAEGEPARSTLSLLEHLPMGILISRGETPLYANRMLLDLSGYPSLAALQAEGGLARFLGGLTPTEMPSRSKPFSIRTRQGDEVPAQSKLQAISWEGEPASLLTLQPLTHAAHASDAQSSEAQSLAAELQHREAELREVRAILESATDGVALLDANGRILSLNRPAETLFGYEQNELAGEPFTMLLAPDSRRLFSEHLEKMGEENTTHRVGNGREVAVIAPEGGTIPIVLSLARIGGGDRQASFCAVVHNLATSRGAEKAARDAREEAERASAVKSDFLAKVSHEIRTPLNAIIGFAEVIMDERLGPVGTERYKDYLRDIHKSGTHVMSLVNDLLDLSKIEAGKMALDIKPVDANAIITECVGLMQPQANRERVIMRLALAPRLMHVAADERSLRQIILNLLSNAVKYNEPGGQVIVSTAMTESGHAVIRIKDTGIGMSDAELAVALEPFRQVATARSVSGTGLGLPLTKALIEANRADFTIRSRKNEGTLVEVTFLPARVLAESA